MPQLQASIPCLMLCEGSRLIEQSVLEVLVELMGGVVHQAVAKGRDELVAGMVGADDPLAHG